MVCHEDGSRDILGRAGPRLYHRSKWLQLRPHYLLYIREWYMKPPPPPPLLLTTPLACSKTLVLTASLELLTTNNARPHQARVYPGLTLPRFVSPCHLQVPFHAAGTSRAREVSCDPPQAAPPPLFSPLKPLPQSQWKETSRQTQQHKHPHSLQSVSSRILWCL